MPTSFRISQYFTLVVLACVVGAFLDDLRFGAAYAVAAAGILLPLHLFRYPRRFYYTALLAAGTIWLTHMVRPFLLAASRESFMYPRLGGVSYALMERALVKIGILGFLMLLGLWLGYRLSARERDPDLEEGHDPAGRLLLRGRVVVNLLLLAAVVLKGFLLLRFGVGMRGGGADPRLAFLGRMIPELLVYSLAVYYLGRLGSVLRWDQKGFYVMILAGMSFLALLQGSKAFMAQIGLAVFIFYLASRGDFRIRIRRAVVLGVAGVVLLLVSFPVGNTIRRFVNERGYQPEVIDLALANVGQVFRPDQIGFYVDWVTGRFLGFDGMLATEISRPPELVRTFSAKETGRRIIARITPLTGERGRLSSGKAVGTFFTGHSLDVLHSGGVGLFAAAQLMAGSFGAPLVLFLVGFGWDVFFTQSERIRGPSGRFLLQYLGAYGIIWWTMSGNSDYVISSLIVSAFHLLFFSLVVRFMFGSVR